MHPVLLDLPLPWSGRFLLPSYGLCLTVGFLSAILLGHVRAMRRGLDPDVMSGFYVWLIVSGMAGGRLTFVLQHLDTFRQAPLDALAIWKGGLVVYGGIATAFAVCSLYVWWHGLSVAEVADLSVPSLALGQMFGRVGCFLNGCCYGAPTTMPWGMAFPRTAHDLMPRHPTQLYEAAGLFAGVLALNLFYHRARREGDVALAYFAFYAPLRFVIEVFRDDDRGPAVWFGLSFSQGAGVLALVLCLLLVAARARRGAEVACTR